MRRWQSVAAQLAGRRALDLPVSRVLVMGVAALVGAVLWTIPSAASAADEGMHAFIVVAKSGHNAKEIDLPDDARVTHRYESLFSGYGVTMTRDDAAKLRRDPHVGMVVEETVTGTTGVSPPQDTPSVIRIG